MNRSFLIGLTGSVGMGKSTTAAMFAELGVPVWDADAVVHRLYAAGGAGVGAISDLHPPAIVEGSVDRTILKDWIASDSGALGQIEAAIHPLVAHDRADFVAHAAGGLAVLDIPLLFETGADADVDFIVVVSAPPEVQRERVLARPGMTEARFAEILARQVPDAEKRARADAVVSTESIDHTRAEVARLVERLRREIQNA